MRISDWSSDVCSSDLSDAGSVPTSSCSANSGTTAAASRIKLTIGGVRDSVRLIRRLRRFSILQQYYPMRSARSEERRVGKSVSVRVDLGGRRIIKKKKNRDKRTTIKT